MWQHESGTAVGRILRHDFEEKLSVARFSRDESLFACWSRFLWRSHSPVPSEAGDGRALLSCLCSGGFIPPSSFCCRGAALLRPIWAGSMPSRPGAPIKPFACVLTIAALEVWQSTRARRLRETTPWTLLPRCPAPLPLKAARARPSAPVLSFADSEALQPSFYSREESGASCCTQRGEPRHSPLSHRLSRAEHGPVARLVHTPAPPCYP